MLFVACCYVTLKYFVEQRETVSAFEEKISKVIELFLCWHSTEQNSLNGNYEMCKRKKLINSQIKQGVEIFDGFIIFK